MTFASIALPTSVFVALLAVVAAVRSRSRLRRLQENFSAERDAHKATLASVSDLVQVSNAEGKLLFVNRAWSERLGYTLETLGALQATSFLAEPFGAVFEAAVTRARSGEVVSSLPVSLTSCAGDVFQVEATIQWVPGVPHGGNPCVLTVMRDVTGAKRVDAMKDEFTATLSHELKTPLTSIRGALGLILTGTQGEVPEGLREMVEIAHRSTDRMRELIANLLDMERMATGRMSYHCQPVLLMPLIEDAIEDCYPMGARCGVDVRLTESLPEARISADGARVQQVVKNLVVNAQKFSERGATVEVSVSRRGGLIRVSVCDQGQGIPPEFQAQVFDKFTQADSSITRSGSGVGIGLALSKSIIDAHGGTIDFESRPGQGTTFWFELKSWDGSSLETRFS